MRGRTPADCMKMQQPPRRALKQLRRAFKQPRRAFKPSIPPTRLATWLTLLCIALVLFCGAMQAGHVHDAAFGTPDTHAACSLCVTAHVGVAVTATPVLHAGVSVTQRTEPRRTAAAFPAPANFDLFTRPPPVDPTLA